MCEFKKYKMLLDAEIRPITVEERNGSATKLRSLGISVSPADIGNGSPKVGDMIGRNPKDHSDQWLIAKEYFEDNFQLVTSETQVKKSPPPPPPDREVSISGASRRKNNEK